MNLHWTNLFAQTARLCAKGLPLVVVAACGGGSGPSTTNTDNTKAQAPASAEFANVKRSGQAISAAAAALTPDSDPIIAGPKNVSAVAGEPVEFVAELATQAGDVVTWVSAGGEVETASCDKTYTANGVSKCSLSSAALEHEGSVFSIRVTRSNGDLVFESQLATLTVTPVPVAVVITSQPIGQTVPAGQVAMFRTEAEGSRLKRKIREVCAVAPCPQFEYLPPTIQWYKNGTAILGATANELILPTAASAAGTESVITVKVTNGVGTTVSESAMLTVASASTVVGVSGGTVPGPRGSSLILPPGAVVADAAVALTEEDIPAGLVPPEFIPVGKVIRVSSSNAVFAVPAELKVQGPTSIPPDMALAVARLDGPGGAVGALMKKLSLTPQNQALPAVASCVNPQNNGIDGSVTVPLPGSARYLVYQLPAANCPYIDPIKSGQLPSPTDKPCLNSAEYAEVNGSSGADEQTLVSRHVDCRRTLAAAIVEQTIDLQVDLLQKADGTYSVLTDPTAIPSGTSVVTFEYGTARLESRLSIYGESKKLTKDLRYELRLSGFKRNASYPGAATGAPQFANVVFQPNVTCDSYVNATDVSCDVKAVEISVPLFNAGWTRGLTSTSFRWTKEAGQINDIQIFRLALNNYFYKMNGASFVYYGSQTQRRTVNSKLGSSPELRCDKGVAQLGTKGCVFTAAAPVYDVTQVNPAVKDIIDHIANAQAGLSSPISTPGKFQMKPGTRAVASGLARSKALQRLKNVTLQDKNRTAACGSTNSVIVIRPSSSLACSLDLTLACSCDEYPFASTWQGVGVFPGYFDAVSARIVNANENTRAGGGNLSSKFYLRERVIDFTVYSPAGGYTNQVGDDFWVFAK